MGAKSAIFLPIQSCRTSPRDSSICHVVELCSCGNARRCRSVSMGTRLLGGLLFAAVSASLVGTSFAQTPAPRPLITQPIVESQVVTLKGNTHPLAQPQFDIGIAPPNLPMQRMLLVLR